MDSSKDSHQGEDLVQLGLKFLQLRAALTGAVFDKGLKLAPESRQTKSVGEMVGLLSMDVEKIRLATGARKL